MKKIITFTALFVFAFFAIAQDHSAESRTVRKVNDKGTKGIECQYFFPNLKNYNVSEGSTAFTRIGLKDFTFLKTIGKPALPAHYDLVLLPEGAKTKIVLKVQNLLSKATCSSTLPCATLPTATAIRNLNSL